MEKLETRGDDVRNLQQTKVEVRDGEVEAAGKKLFKKIIEHSKHGILLPGLFINVSKFCLLKVPNLSLLLHQIYINRFFNKFVFIER